MGAYYSGNPDHADKKRIYLADSRQMQTWLIDNTIKVYKWTFLVEWISDAPTKAGEGRIKVLADAKKLHADNNGIYRLA